MSGSRRPSRALRSRLLALPLGALMVGFALPAVGQETDPFAGAPAWDEYGFQGEGEARLPDLDARAGVVAATASQTSLAAGLGATAVRWNAFGTPHVLTRHGGYLTGPRAGEAADVARAFVREHAELFRLDAAAVDALEVLRDSPLYDSPDLARAYGIVDEPVQNPDVAHVVTFQQRFGGLEAVVDGLLTVGVQRDGRISWATSSITGDSALSGDQRVTAAAAVEKAAADIGMDLGRLSDARDSERYTTFAAERVRGVQRARPVALPTPGDGVRRAWEVTLLDTELDDHGNPTAFVTVVDAEDGRIWHRTNKLDHFAAGASAGSVTLPAAFARMPSTQPAPPGGGAYSGTTDRNGCGPLHEFEVPEGIAQITVTAQSPENPNTDTVNADLTVAIVHEGRQVAFGDTLGNPEAATYSPPPSTLPGTYAAKVCNFDSSDPPFDYTGNFILSPVGTGEVVDGGPLGDLPTWRVFPANPPFVAGRTPAGFSESEDTRVLWCWDISRFGPGVCDEELRNTAARTPWDVNGTSTPSFTTDGNYASTAISEASFLTPDSALNRPFSATREYDYPWGNKWFESSCNPTNFGTVADDRNDEQASTANLFAMHNRMHDWSYYLGFTEINSNLQKTNFGNTGPARENDPELGSSQAGRRTVNGRDNANQITLQDGTPGITNQYLWQPLAGAFYSPCVDGAYDMAVVAHEYGHAISNRMIAGPDTGTGPTQGQTESWSDLIFAGYFTEFAISAGEGVNPYVLGPYVTGDPGAGIRNYAMNESPLNYSNLDYDPNGLGSPHANGEIWSAVNFDILESLNAKYDADFPSSDSALQVECARGELPARFCPGNRRWNQIQFDSFLLQPSGATQVDSRDGMLAADQLRFDGANQAELWDAFARRGLGELASAVDAADVQSVPSFESPLRDDEASVRFVPPAGASDMRVYVGRFESNSVPVADTVAGGDPTDTARFVPGQYEFVAQAPGFGAQRFTLDLSADEDLDFQVPLRRNHASATHGAVATGDGVNLPNIIDDTESTNWASLTSEGTASEGNGEGEQVAGREVVVELAGDAPVTVREVQVSAALRPLVPAEEEEGELPTDTPDTPPDPDPGNQSRFSALRAFDIQACNADLGDCSTPEGFTTIFESADDAFPSTRPRPRIPDHILRPFDVTDTLATHIKLVVRTSQCTGGPDFQGETNPDSDPLFNPDCDTTTPSPDRAVLRPPVQQVRASELQVFSETTLTPPGEDTGGGDTGGDNGGDTGGDNGGDTGDRDGGAQAGGRPGGQDDGQAVRSGAGPTPGTSAPVRAAATLPRTGTEGLVLLALGCMAVVAGTVLTVSARRRET